jgi:hypothetical protein
MSKEQGSILRQAAEILRLHGCTEVSETVNYVADKIDPNIDRSLRGWVLVTDHEGDQSVRWATDTGLGPWRGELLSELSWDGAERSGWTVEPFPTGYSEAEVQHVLERTGASASTVGNALYHLRRLKEDR